MPALAASIATASPRAPTASISLTTAAARSAERVYVITTSVPSAASRRAMAAPIPRLPPVTSATLCVMASPLSGISSA
jgi:hypothetical protein